MAASPCLSQISGCFVGSSERSAATSFTPPESTTRKPTFAAPGFSLTHAKRPYESSPANGAPAGQVIGSWMSPQAYRPQSA